MSLCGNNNPCPDLITGQCGITYTGARYVPLFADPAQWDNTKTYEPLTIVLNEGNSYTSKTFVPVGVDISNEQYWALTGNYNAQVEAYRQEVIELKNEIGTINKNTLSWANVVKFGVDNTGDSAQRANNTSVVQQLISLYDVLYFPYGSYALDTITLQNSDKCTHIIGDSKFSTFLLFSGDGIKSTKVDSDPNNAYSIEINNLNIQGSGSGIGVNCYGHQGVYNDLIIKNFNVGFETITGEFINSNLTNIYVINCTDYGYKITGNASNKQSNKNLLLNCCAYNIGSGTPALNEPGHGLYLQDVNNIVIGCTFQNCAGCGIIVDCYSKYCLSTMIMGCYFESNKFTNIGIYNNNMQYIDGLYVKGSYFNISQTPSHGNYYFNILPTFYNLNNYRIELEDFSLLNTAYTDRKSNFENAFPYNNISDLAKYYPNYFTEYQSKQILTLTASNPSLTMNGAVIYIDPMFDYYIGLEGLSTVAGTNQSIQVSLFDNTGTYINAVSVNTSTTINTWIKNFKKITLSADVPHYYMVARVNNPVESGVNYIRNIRVIPVQPIIA